MSDTQAVVDLVGRADELPRGTGQVALYEEAVALADALGDDDLGAAVRERMMWPAYEAYRPDLLLVHYAWCLAYLDRDTDRPARSLLWKYRLVVDRMPTFSALTRPQIDAAWRDMHDRYRAAGYSLRPVWTQRRRLAEFVGDGPLADDADRRYRTHPPDALADSAEDVFDAQYAAFRRRDAACLAAADRLLAGRSFDGDYAVAHVTAAVLLPLARAGRVADGVTLQKRAGRVARSRPEFDGTADAQVTFLTVAGDLAGAGRLFDWLFPRVHARTGDLAVLNLYHAALFLARELVRHNRKPALKVPAGLIPGVAGTRTPPGPLRDWLEVALPELCRRADARNGNSYYTDRLDDLDGYARLAKKLARV